MQKRFETSRFINIFLLALLLVGCGSAADNSSARAGPTPNTTTNYYVYVVNAIADTVTAYRIDPGTGQLTKVGPAVATDRYPQFIIVAPRIKFAYVVNQISETVSIYKIDAASGALQPVSAVVSTGTSPSSIAVDPTGKFAYVANSHSHNISAYKVDAASGILQPLVPVGSYSTIDFPHSVAADPTGQFIYVASKGADPAYVGGVQGFRIDPGSGALTPTSTIAHTGVSFFSVAVAPVGQFGCNVNENHSLGVGEISCGGIDAFGNLVFGYNADAGPQPRAVAIDPTGNFAFVANSSVNSVSAYRVKANKEVILANEVATDAYPQAIAVEQTGKYAYVVNSDSDTIWIFRINDVTGELSVVGSLDTQSYPVSITTVAIPQ